MNSVYVDTFSDDFDMITLSQLEKDYAKFKRDGEIEENTFAEYLENCMVWNNGALCPVHDCVVDGSVSDCLCLTIEDCIYIMRESFHLGPSAMREIFRNRLNDFLHVTRPELIELVNEYMNH